MVQQYCCLTLYWIWEFAASQSCRRECTWARKGNMNEPEACVGP